MQRHTNLSGGPSFSAIAFTPDWSNVMMFIFEANAPYIYISAVHSSRDAGRGGGIAPLVFGKSVNPIPTRAHHITTCPPRFLDGAAPLRSNGIFFMLHQGYYRWAVAGPSESRGQGGSLCFVEGFYADITEECPIMVKNDAKKFKTLLDWILGILTNSQLI